MSISTPGPRLATVRRFEAAGLRAWPAASVQYDGAWQVRLTAGHPSRRLNSVNALDPSDHRDVEARVARAAVRFETYGRLPVFRQTPLSPQLLDAYLEAEGWSLRDETLVMRAPIDAMALDDVPDRLPLRDRWRYLQASQRIQGRGPDVTRGLADVVAAIRPPVGLFLLEDREGDPLASVMCVRDGELAGIFELGTSPSVRGRGYGATMLKTALRWARLHGARQAWLQVEADNAAAVALYRRLGFEEIYRYAYRQPARRSDVSAGEGGVR